MKSIARRLLSAIIAPELATMSEVFKSLLENLRCVDGYSRRIQRIQRQYREDPRFRAGKRQSRNDRRGQCRRVEAAYRFRVGTGPHDRIYRFAGDTVADGVSSPNWDSGRSPLRRCRNPSCNSLRLSGLRFPKRRPLRALRCGVSTECNRHGRCSRYAGRRYKPFGVVVQLPQNRNVHRVARSQYLRIQRAGYCGVAGNACRCGFRCVECSYGDPQYPAQPGRCQWQTGPIARGSGAHVA